MSQEIQRTKSSVDPSTFDAVVDKAFHIARVAEAVALRSIKKVRVLFFIGMLSAVWLSYYVARSFELTLLSAAAVLLILALPPLVLGKLYGTLRKTVGLPQRLLQSIEKIKGRTAGLELKLAPGASQGSANKGAKLSELWRLGKMLLEVKSLSGEAREITSVLGDALILANPVFTVLLVISAVVTLTLLFVALGTGIAYIL